MLVACAVIYLKRRICYCRGLNGYTSISLWNYFQGYIRVCTIKLNYRKRLLRSTLAKMEQDQTANGPELASSVTLLDAVMWWKASWDLVSADTIEKCFAA